MTNDPGNFLPLSGFGGFNFLTSGTQPSEKGVAPAQRNTCRLWDDARDPKWIGRGEITVYGFPQGLNHPEGDFSTNSDGYLWADLVTYRTNELVPPPAVVSLTDASIGGTFTDFHTCAAFSTVFMGIGSAANHALFKETSTTDPTPVAITHSPASSICSLSRTLASGAERLAVGYVGNPTKLMDNASGNVASTMHSSTNSTWGIIMSGVNADPTKAGTPQLLIYAGTTIGYKSSDADMTTAITTSHTGVPAGGFAIGAIKAAGRAQMAYWGIPQVSATSGAKGAYCNIIATPMDGTSDSVPVDLKLMPNGVVHAEPFLDGILAHDGKHVVYWDGDDEFDLGLIRKRLDAQTSRTTTSYNINYEVKPTIKGLVVNGAECGVLVTYLHSNGVTVLQTYLEMYKFENGTWHNVHTRVTNESALDVNTLVRGSAMSTTGMRYWWINGGTVITGMFIPRTYESLLWQHSGGSALPAPEFTHNSSLMGTRWRIDVPPPGTIPGFKTIARMPKVPYEIEFNGNLDYGGGDWDFRIQVFGFGTDGVTRHQAANCLFEQGNPSAHYVQKVPTTAWTNIFDIQLFLTAVASGLTRKSAQLVPFTVRFLYSKTGELITPEEVITPGNSVSLTGREKVA